MPDRDHTRRRRARRGIPGRVAGAAVVLALVAGCGGSGGGRGSSTGTAATTPVVLGSDQGEATGRTVDGIRCQTQEQVRYHIHAHVSVFDGSHPGIVPAGIGIAPPRTSEMQSDGTPFVLGGSCFYWLHSHTADGIIHIESPDRRTYTLGSYFDLWNQPLSRTRVAGAAGPVTAYLNGQMFTGDPRAIPLSSHAVIALDVGSRAPRAAYAFPTGL